MGAVVRYYLFRVLISFRGIYSNLGLGFMGPGSFWPLIQNIVTSYGSESTTSIIVYPIIHINPNPSEIHLFSLIPFTVDRGATLARSASNFACSQSTRQRSQWWC